MSPSLCNPGPFPNSTFKGPFAGDIYLTTVCQPSHRDTHLTAPPSQVVVGCPAASLAHFQGLVMVAISGHAKPLLGRDRSQSPGS
mmetsp:Transcript_43681/g.78602  ORF Transcript_43681/g.78602 Transcript_43681/m.78602 type:complete len:85 (+) Transcript_43681:1236-1490(+)